MLKMKYKLISAAMVIAPILSTGVATTVSAAPGHPGPASKPGVIYKYYYGSFTSRLNSLVASGVINSYQESRVLGVFNAGGNFKAGLDSLVASDVINSYQESTILSIFDYYSSDYSAPRAGHNGAPNRSGAANPGNQSGANKGGAVNSGNQGGANKGGAANPGNQSGANKGGAVNSGNQGGANKGGAVNSGNQGGANKGGQTPVAHK
jgi:hypothetical protein